MTLRERWNAIRPWALAVAAALVVALVGPRFCRSPLLANGTTAPAFSLPRLDAPGTRITDADLRGRPSVLFFWAVWCPACTRMMPGIEALARERPAVLFLGIHADGEVDPRSVAAKAARTPSMLHVTGGDTILGRWRATTFPTTYVIGSDGRICEGFAGRADPDDVADALDGCP